jgi:hypothetical protein
MGTLMGTGDPPTVITTAMVGTVRGAGAIIPSTAGTAGNDGEHCSYAVGRAIR